MSAKEEKDLNLISKAIKLKVETSLKYDQIVEEAKFVLETVGPMLESTKDQPKI